jgi:predicted RNA-binding Zn-ribbon protein involved in translation (DUF1610 family)
MSSKDRQQTMKCAYCGREFAIGADHEGRPLSGIGGGGIGWSQAVVEVVVATGPKIDSGEGESSGHTCPHCGRVN